MTLPANNPLHSRLVGAGGSTAGEDYPFAALGLLDTDVYRDMRWCSRCAGPQVFVEVYECEAGRVGFCFGCAEERLVPYSRVNS
jgi:hypothetical protein